MLIPTISFEITDFITGNSESFLIEHTIENEEFVHSFKPFRDETHKSSIRQIRYDNTFDFQFAREVKAPLALFAIVFENAAMKYAGVADLDDIDEMVGTF